jgi:hypothetical protein
VWDLVDSQDEPIRSDYWRRLGGVYGDYSAGETERALAALVSVGQLNVALDIASEAHDKLQPETALDLLERLARAPEPERTRLMKDGSAGYHLERVFEAVDRMNELPDERLVRLEIAFLGFLEHTQRGARRLGSALAKQPEVFVEFLARRYKAESGAGSEPELTSEEKQAREASWRIAYEVLEAWKGFPGEELEPGEQRESTAIAWAEEALRLSTEADRAQIGAYVVGKVLARMPASSGDATWPSLAAREILRKDTTTEVGSGIYIEKLNSRGVTSRALGEGGRQERQLSATFSESAAKLRLEWPEAAAVLDRLADNYEREAEREDAEAAADRHRYKMDAAESSS